MLTHIDENNNPTMVDVSDKSVTNRSATAQTKVILPKKLSQYIRNNEIYLKKGPVFQVAIVAAVQACKQTSFLIPFCHQLPIESCKVDIRFVQATELLIEVVVKTSAKTGVEMEALVASNIAALTIYDMCKAVSSDIIIGKTSLVHKSGGKKNYRRRPLYGLVLTGGMSSRMQRDKALINYAGKPHAQYLYELLSLHCDQVFISAKQNQWAGTELDTLPTIFDDPTYDGPLAGILSAFHKHQDVDFLVLACDLAKIDDSVITNLIAHYDPDKDATCYKNPQKGFPEALCAIYSNHIFPKLKFAYDQSIKCPVKILSNLNTQLIDPLSEESLINVNTVNELEAIYDENN
jgi:cyclic pyranopterin phosphate synthase